MSALQRILDSKALPSLPTVAVKLLDLSRDPSASMKAFVEAVQSDPAIAAKILKLSNSSYLGIRSNVTTLQRAVTLLGTRSVTSMALAFSIARQSVGEGETAKAFGTYWRRSVLQAVAAEAQSDSVPEHTPSELFLAGLMLDIGQLAMLRTLGKKYAELVSAPRGSIAPLIERERMAFGFDHSEAGAALLQRWNFPPMLVEAAGRHHEDEVRAGDSPEAAALLSACRVARAAGEYFFAADAGRGLAEFQNACRRERGLDEAGTLDFAEDLSEGYRENADVFDADGDSLPEPSEIMAAANEQLAAAAARAQLENEQSQLAREELESQRNELETQNHELRRQTVVDPLTGCFNRTFFNESLDQEVDVCRRTARPVGVLFMDIDRFKQLNDTHGHPFGDEVLVGTAAALKVCLRESDVLCRYGGEEFVVLARQATERGLEALAERLRAAVAACRFEFDGKPVPVTVSVGSAHAIPGLTDDAMSETLVREADEAMYEAKNGGRNRVVVRSLVSPAERRLLDAAESRTFSKWLVAEDLLTAEQSAEAACRVRPPSMRLGEVAVEYGLLTAGQVEALVERQNLGGRRQRIGRLAVEAGWLDEDALATLLGLQRQDPRDLARAVAETGAVPPPTLAAAVQRFRETLLPAAEPMVAC